MPYLWFSLSFYRLRAPLYSLVMDGSQLLLYISSEIQLKILKEREDFAVYPLWSRINISLGSYYSLLQFLRRNCFVLLRVALWDTFNRLSGSKWLSNYLYVFMSNVSNAYLNLLRIDRILLWLLMLVHL